MQKHNFDFDDAMSVNEFFKSNGVKKNKSFIIKTCYPSLKDEDGDTILDKDGKPEKDYKNPFQAVGFANGETLDDGRPSYTFFCLSRKLEEAGETLDKAFLKAHKEDLMLLEPVDDLRFGIAFLASGAEDWDEL